MGLKRRGFYGLSPMHYSPSANRSFSLLDTLNVLPDGLPIRTSYTQLLKSRIGRTLSLFNFCRYRSDRLFYYNIQAFHPLPLKRRGPIRPMQFMGSLHGVACGGLY